MLAIVNYGVGNLRSVENMLRKAEVPSTITSDPEVIQRADRLILPGVGNFGHGMKKLRDAGLTDVLDWFALEEKRPVLGICLGAQIIGNSSEEGEGAGLGWIDMECKRFPEMDNLRIPHMSWNKIEPTRQSPLFDDLLDDSQFYFVHSYRMICADESNSLATTEYGIKYTSAVQHNNIYGVQFHPEKSHKHGLTLLKAFATI